MQNRREVFEGRKMAEEYRFPYAQNDLVSDVRDKMLVLTINRQARYNAWTEALREEFTRKLLDANEAEDVDALIITGAGPNAFCAGADLGETNSDSDAVSAGLERFIACYDAVRSFSKPLVAAVNGVAAGSGFQLIQFCDYVVAHPGVRMGQTEVNSGLPSVFGTWLMWERIGSRAYELSLQGRLMLAEEAKQLGFVNEIVEQSKVLHTALDVARRLANQPRLAFKLSKAANRQFDKERYAEAMKRAIAVYREAFENGEAQRQVSQFFENRRDRKTDAHGG
ncbi:enoyl-CoA hydratase/isomerase family protein [Bradyrhizobium macuxiense]|nr:enoyl-CoA hydratase/isomerase family protein [Bradyrhizobium macuxiense]